MTNADVIRKMTDEQLFEFLSEWELGDIDYSITFCDLCMESKREGGKGNELGLDCDGCREHWLKRDAVDYSGLLYWKKNTTYGEQGRGMSGDVMSKEQYDFIKGIQDYMLVATNMKKSEAWDFAFRIWQSEGWLFNYMANDLRSRKK